jgi:hypothetical protein
MRMRWMAAAAAAVSLAAGTASAASNYDEFKIKREAVFEFVEKPRITRHGDRFEIRFETKSFCDGTVAIEEAPGRIIRHLASGVLGPNAPAPFEKNSKKQTVVWDGKDDQGVYIDQPERLTVRVSLGLRAQFERTLFWSPKKRIAPGNRPLFAAAPEGVYVFEGGGVDHIRLFDHAGNYVRTVYPFPPDRSSPKAGAGPRALQAALAKVRGLDWAEYPQDGRWLPLWKGLVQATLFTSGDNTGDNTLAKYGRAASALARHQDRLALAMLSLNRMATDGTTGGMDLNGPKTSFLGGYGRKETESTPRSAAFSPDGRTLYLTGYWGDHNSWLHGVVRMDFLGDREPTVFAGRMDERGDGTDNAHFRCPGAVVCDAQGRVYVTDYMNDRIQVFDPSGKHLKSIAPVSKPLNLFIHPKTGHLYVGSYMLVNRFIKSDKVEVPATLSEYGPFDAPRHIATWPLEFENYNPTVSWNRTGGVQHEVFVDCFADPPVVWVVPGTGDTAEKLLQLRASYSPSQYRRGPWMNTHYRLYTAEGGRLIKRADFAEDVAKAVGRVTPPQAPSLDRQRLYVHPLTGDLYLAEGDSGVGKAVRQLLKIDPDTGQVSFVDLPFTSEDLAFEPEGRICLRTDRQVSRFDLRTWREIPWDYGGEWERPGFDGDGGTLAGALALPGTGRPGCFHLGGFAISPKGHMAISCYNVQALDVRIPGAFGASFAAGKPYTAPQYPGRTRWGEVHVWDKYGRMVYEDAIAGLPMTDGLAIDKDDHLYALVAANRVLDGQEYLLERAETLMKFAPRRGRFLSTRKELPTPLPAADGPKRPFDVAKGFAGQAWVEGAEWMYGGVGFGGFNSSKGGGGCACWNARFALDLFARSFATELNRFCVAVLDTNGNLIMRIGDYGNVDDGVPLVKAGGPANPRPVGGDEVALLHPSYVATHTDHRLFIADYGNYRILSVRLDYHASERVPLGGAADGGRAN